MRLSLYIFLVFILLGCSEDKTASDLVVDHFNIWVKNPQVAKEKLEAIGFTGVPDSLSMIHKGQGTTGRYFYFLNSYLEFIFVNDKKEFRENAEKNNELDFIERSNNSENGFCPFSISLKMENYDKEKVPFEIIEYSQDWMGEYNEILVAKNSKLKKEEPSLFIIYPEIEYDVFESMTDLSKIPEDYSIWREFYKHENGAEKISTIKIHTTHVDNSSETIKILKELNQVEIVEGKEYLMELYFDQAIQNKVYDFRPEIPLKIHF